MDRTDEDRAAKPFGDFLAPCGDLTCRSHATGQARDCECGGWKRWEDQKYHEGLVSGFWLLPPIIGIVPPLPEHSA